MCGLDVGAGALDAVEGAVANGSAPASNGVSAARGFAGSRGELGGGRSSPVQETLAAAKRRMEKSFVIGLVGRADARPARTLQQVEPRGA